jgi:uncharacterized SAM-binding protein YcdF (DUF218 family)
MAHWLFKIGVWSLFFLAIWLGGFLWFTFQIPRPPLNDERPADAIIVLTGGAGRLEHGLKLLAEGKGKALFVSGAGEGTTVADVIAKASPEVHQTLQGMAKPPIFLGHQAENTIGNAEETAQWITDARYKTIRLVTANYHLPRSINEFREMMPGLVIIPDPVFPVDYDFNSWWRDPGTRTLLFAEYHKYLASRLRHWFVLAVRS